MRRSRLSIDHPSEAMRAAWPHLFLNPPFLGYHHQSCGETKPLDFLIGVRAWKRETSHPPLDSLLGRLALELARLPLLELGRSFTWGGRAPADTGGWFDLSFGLQVHFSCGFCRWSCGVWSWRSSHLGKAKREGVDLTTFTCQMLADSNRRSPPAS